MTRDLRRYGKQTMIRLLFGGIVILFLVGDGLIYLFYGPEAALMGLICLAGGLAPLLLVWFILSLMGWVVKSLDE